MLKCRRTLCKVVIKKSTISICETYTITLSDVGRINGSFQDLCWLLTERAFR